MQVSSTSITTPSEVTGGSNIGQGEGGELLEVEILSLPPGVKIEEINSDSSTSSLEGREAGPTTYIDLAMSPPTENLGRLAESNMPNPEEAEEAWLGHPWLPNGSEGVHCQIRNKANEVVNMNYI